MTKLVGKDVFSVDVLSDESRQLLIEKAKNYNNIEAEKAINYYVDYLSGRVAQSSKNKMLDAIDHMKKLDVVRNTNCIELFKDMIELENLDV